MNKWLISTGTTVILAIAGWWFLRAEGYFTIVDQLRYRSLYFNGQSKEAPIDPPKTTPSPSPQ